MVLTEPARIDYIDIDCNLLAKNEVFCHSTNQRAEVMTYVCSFIVLLIAK